MPKTTKPRVEKPKDEKPVEKAEISGEELVKSLEKQLSILRTYVSGLSDEQKENEVHKVLFTEISAMLDSKWSDEARNFLSNFKTWFKSASKSLKGANAAKSVTEEMHKHLQAISARFQELDTESAKLKEMLDQGANEHAETLKNWGQATLDSRPALTALGDIETIIRRAAVPVVEAMLGRRGRMGGSSLPWGWIVGMGAAAVILAGVYFSGRFM